MTVEDHIPSGLEATSVTGVDVYANSPDGLVYPFVAFQHPEAMMECSVGTVVTCTTSDAIPVGDQLNLRIKVSVKSGAPTSMTNEATVSGGGASTSASNQAPVTVSSEPVSFGFAAGSLMYGVGSHAAGAHSSVTTGFALNATGPASVADSPKDVSFALPPGAVGNTVGMPRCPIASVAGSNCPVNTIVGIVSVEFRVASLEVLSTLPVFNITPSSSEPAAFALDFSKAVVRFDTKVLSNGEYRVQVNANNIEQVEPSLSAYITIWGIPADHQGPGGINVKTGDVKRARIRRHRRSAGQHGASPAVDKSDPVRRIVDGVGGGGCLARPRRLRPI